MTSIFRIYKINGRSNLFSRKHLIEVTNLIIISIIAMEDNNTKIVYLSFLSQPIYYEFGCLFIQGVKNLTSYRLEII